MPTNQQNEEIWRRKVGVEQWFVMLTSTLLKATDSEATRGRQATSVVNDNQRQTVVWLV